MSNSDLKGNQNSNFDFSQPPPGYSVPGYGGSKSYKSFKAGNKESKGYDTSNFNIKTTDKMLFERSGSTTPSQNNFPEVNRLSNQDQNSLDPRMYALPPPPPPAEPYSPSPALPAGPYVFNPTVYSAYSVPPPSIAGSFGAGQYVAPQQEIYHPGSYQRDYDSGYSNRGGYFNRPINNRKRKTSQEMEQESQKKPSRKKKKPLSQNMPARKDWSVEDATRALEVEREFNKRHKSQPLIIKFPDLELNRDIVAKFHSQIDSVHFHRPSTPRFCFVTLKDSANMEEVIQDLNKIKFGDGYLTVEPKKDREEDLNIGPEDIDPLNLYVGNLAQEVTVDDVIKAYPKNKRIDIGFAKKMKYTRYAFVSFRTVDDAIEAFQNTHATEMYNKSLIVRFRRLHGTVGLPGEPKPQNQKRTEQQNQSDSNENSFDLHMKDDDMDNSSFRLKDKSDRIFSYGSDDDCDDEDEEAQYSHNIRNAIYNSLDGDRVDDIKKEPLDYDWVAGHQSDEPVDEKPHLPILQVKEEQDVKPIKIKKENDEWDDKTWYI